MADTRISNNNNTSTTAVVLSDEDDMWNDELMEKYAQQMEEQYSSQSSSQPDNSVIGVKRAASAEVPPPPAAKKMRTDHLKTEPGLTVAQPTRSAAFVVPANTQKRYDSAYLPPQPLPTAQGQQYTNCSKPPSVVNTPPPRTPPARIAQPPANNTVPKPSATKQNITTNTTSSCAGHQVATNYDVDSNSVSDAEDGLSNKLEEGIPLDRLNKYHWTAHPSLHNVAQLANLIFGYDGWSWAIASANFIKEPVKLEDGQWIVYAECTVRVTVRCGVRAR